MSENAFEHTTEEEVGGLHIADLINELWSDFLQYYRLLLTLIPVCVALSLVGLSNIEPTYTATAVLGPSTSLDSLNSNDALGGLTKKLRGSPFLGMQGMSPNFDEFTALLTSNRLAAKLAKKPGILPMVFYQKWDNEKHQWKPRTSMIAGTIDFLKRLIGRPVKPFPDQDDLYRFLDKNLTVSTSLSTSYITVELKFRDRAQAEQLIQAILFEADNIIREDKRRDVKSRIAYLTRTLDELMRPDLKDAIISTLADQQQQMMLIASDFRYASMFIDMPYVPVRPTAPNPILFMLAGFMLSLVSWYMIVRYFPKSGWQGSALKRFESRRVLHRAETAA